MEYKPFEEINGDQIIEIETDGTKYYCSVEDIIKQNTFLSYGVPVYKG